MNKVEITRTFDLLEHLLQNYSDKETILSNKVNGEWVKYNALEYYRIAHYMAYGIAELGIQPGDRVITMSQNCPEWNFVDMALSMSGVIHVPIYPTLTPESYLYMLNHCDAKMVLIGSNVLYKRIKPALDKLENKPIVYCLNKLDDLPPTRDILKLGIANREKWLPVIEERKRSIQPTDWCTLIYTSGTTGDPKGVMLSHQNLCSNFLAHAEVNVIDSKANVLSFLPLNHVYERSMNYHFQYLGCSIYYAESLATIAQNLAECQIDCFCAVPRVLEQVHSKFVAAGKDMKGITKLIYKRAFKHGQRYDYGFVKKISIWYQIMQMFFDKTVYSKWREKLGGKRLVVITGSSSIQEPMVRLFAAAGVNIYEGYGLSETSPVIAVNDPNHKQVKIGTVGPILKGVECKLADDGEILTRGPHVMMGYYKDPDYTKQVIDEEGYFHTGDIGVFIQGKFLKITDRKKDIFKLSGGKYVAPQLLENRFGESEYIDQIMVVGANEKSPAAIIAPNFNSLHYFAHKRKLHYRDNEELVANPEIQKLIKGVLDTMNKEFAPHEQVKDFRLVTEEWTPANGLLSPTLKIRRNVLLQKYKELIDDIYGHTDSKPNTIFSAFKQVELPSLKFPGRN